MIESWKRPPGTIETSYPTILLQQKTIEFIIRAIMIIPMDSDPVTIPQIFEIFSIIRYLFFSSSWYSCKNSKYFIFAFWIGTYEKLRSWFKIQS